MLLSFLRYFMKLCRGYTAKPYVYTTRPICSLEAHELRIKSVCRTWHINLKVGKSYEKRKIMLFISQTMSGHS